MIDLSIFTRRSKKDPIPGTTLDLHEDCPACGNPLIFRRACCSNPFPQKECRNCGFKIVLTDDHGGGPGANMAQISALRTAQKLVNPEDPAANV